MKYILVVFFGDRWGKHIAKAAGVCCLGGRLSCKVMWETLG